jgi:hypothetical protein
MQAAPVYALERESPRVNRSSVSKFNIAQSCFLHFAMLWRALCFLLVLQICHAFVQQPLVSRSELKSLRAVLNPAAEPAIRLVISEDGTQALLQTATYTYKKRRRPRQLSDLTRDANARKPAEQQIDLITVVHLG